MAFNDCRATVEEYAEALEIAAREDREIGRKLAQVMLDALFGLEDVPAPSADEQATDEEGGKDVSARPTRTGCDWLREEGVLRELPN